MFFWLAVWGRILWSDAEWQDSASMENLAANYQCQTCFESILAPLTFGLYFDAQGQSRLASAF